MAGARDAFLAHRAARNAEDREAWLALFADDVTIDDPVGVPTKRGRTALETTWSRSHRPGRSWRLSARRLIEYDDEVAVDLLNVGTIEGATVEVRSIGISKVRRRAIEQGSFPPFRARGRTGTWPSAAVLCVADTRRW